MRARHTATWRELRRCWIGRVWAIDSTVSMQSGWCLAVYIGLGYGVFIMLLRVRSMHAWEVSLGLGLGFWGWGLGLIWSVATGLAPGELRYGVATNVRHMYGLIHAGLPKRVCGVAGWLPGCSAWRGRNIIRFSATLHVLLCLHDCPLCPFVNRSSIPPTSVTSSTTSPAARRHSLLSKAIPD